jgi:signal transduction histidine kinase
MTAPAVKGRTMGRLHYVGAVLWVLLTVSLATWWMIFGLEQARMLRALGGPDAIRLERVQKMLMWEGATFIGLLLAGGIALIVSIRREHARQRAVEAFFMAFTHDLKTALTSLQLQAESLSEDLPAAAAHPNMNRLLRDAVRLGVQLENSLYLAQPEGDLLLEPVRLAESIERAAADWPELTVRVEGDARVLADARALQSVWRNLLQNAVVHGGATTVTARIEPRPDGRATITTTDDGRGAPARVVRTLGRPFPRSGPTRGTGVGLFVSCELARRMRGSLRFGGSGGGGFTAVLELPAAGG